MLKLENLSIEHQTSPIGLDCKEPRFGWVLISDIHNTMQNAYRMIVISEDGERTDTGKIFSSQSTEVTVGKLTVKPKTKYDVKVVVWDNHGNESAICGCFETGFLN